MNQEEIMQQLQVAVAFHNQGELDQAEAIYRKVLSVDANNFYSLRFLGCLQSSKGCYESAISLLRQATTIASNDSVCWFNLGNAYKGQSRFEDAIASYRSAEEYGSINPQNFNNWGRCLQELSKQEQSIPVLEKAVGIDSDCFGAWFALGNSWRDLGQVTQAVFCYKKSIGASPSFEDPYLNLGSLMKEEGEVEEAIVCYRKAIELKPDFAEAYLNLGSLMKEEGEVEEAIVCYRKAIELKPDFADAYFQLGDLLALAGDHEESKSSFLHHYRLKPLICQIGPLKVRNSVCISEFSCFPESIPKSSNFIPSYVSEDLPYGMHLMHVHIPKTAGVRFSAPILDCVKVFFDEGGCISNQSLLQGTLSKSLINYLSPRRIVSDPMRDSIVSMIRCFETSHLDFSFMSTHGVSSRELTFAMQDVFGISPIRIAFWRDPRKRLESALNYLWKQFNFDDNAICRAIADKHFFLDNSIYRHLFNLFCCDVRSHSPKPEIDYLININHPYSMNKLMTCFLSRCRMPNLLVPEKINFAVNSQSMDKNSLRDLMNRCEDNGFLSLDLSAPVVDMVENRLPVEFDVGAENFPLPLHPLTMICVNGRLGVSVNLVQTDFLMTTAGQKYMFDCFGVQ